MRFVAACSENRDTVCESCPEPGAHQFYVGTVCTSACEVDFVLDLRTKQCEYTSTLSAILVGESQK